MRCAVVNLSSGIVENLIVANPTIDDAPIGFVLLELPDESPVSIGWVYNSKTNEFTPDLTLE